NEVAEVAGDPQRGRGQHGRGHRIPEFSQPRSDRERQTSQAPGPVVIVSLNVDDVDPDILGRCPHDLSNEISGLTKSAPSTLERLFQSPPKSLLACLWGRELVQAVSYLSQLNLQAPRGTQNGSIDRPVGVHAPSDPIRLAVKVYMVSTYSRALACVVE